ncbi:uncharacterized protein LOC131002027 [Salvia miltiorrhiza]|uniref:uncharacterized protein LOC130996764 n=1 Tax=Salvia miltiorrhiza TaxID=226208 RepID=UPI0025ABCF93|nr:uncharacterized protein LOC130996764 [Salvia miltiorrhiza]XP_057784684.1 uncharacterized protein LOC131002027 [Salvia miltiorrhiza]
MKIQRLEEYINATLTPSEGLAASIDTTHVAEKVSTATVEIANRISRLEEQALPKRRRDRPLKGMGREHVQHTTGLVPEDSIKCRVRKAVEVGYKLRDYVVDHNSSDNFRAMNNIANRRWSDEVELDDIHTTTDTPYW